MEISQELIKDRFRVFNKELFGGTLRQPRIKIRKYTAVAGLFIAKGDRGTLVISECFDYDESLLDETIIHEIIHCCLWHRGERRALRHGRAFHRECCRIREDYGITIHDKAHHIPILKQYQHPQSSFDKVLYWTFRPVRWFSRPFRYLYNRWF